MYASNLLPFVTMFVLCSLLWVSINGVFDVSVDGYRMTVLGFLGRVLYPVGACVYVVYAVYLLVSTGGAVLTHLALSISSTFMILGGLFYLYFLVKRDKNEAYRQAMQAYEVEGAE